MSTYESTQWGRTFVTSIIGLGRFRNLQNPTVRAIYQRIRSLKTSPNQGRPGHRSGTRELAITPLPYVVVYAVKAEAVEILHIYHGAQDWR